MSIRKILIAVDEQPLSVRAAELGAELGAELARALLGSVAEEVMRNAPCPMLVARAQS
jgi:nucleotide-binding universal stress UspA family protein